MQSLTGDIPPRLYRVVANVGLGIAVLWLLVYLMPAGRDVGLDQILAFVLGLMAVGLLWWAAYLGIQPRGLWGWLAAAWTLDLLGDVTWGLYELLVGKTLPTVSWIDALYLARYALILAAFWRGLHLPTGRHWIRLLVLLPLAAIAVVGGFFLSVPASRQTVFWLSGAVYPVLDAGLLYVAWEAWRLQPVPALRNALGLIALALLAYGAANCLNFYGQAIPYDAASGLAAFFWPLADILAGAAVLSLLWAGTVPAPAEPDDQTEAGEPQA